MGLTTAESICVNPEYEGNNFFGYTNLKKSIMCEINTTNTATIRSIDGFREMVDVAKSGTFNISINLDTDLDLDTDDKFTLPVGMNEAGTCNMYSGTFDGNGHSIKNLKMNNIDKDKDSSIFCGLDGATMKNIHIDKTCEISGREASGLSIIAKGEVVIMNVSNEATIISSSVRGAGLISSVEDAITTNLTMINCGNKGNVVSKSGGISCGLICSDSNDQRGSINIMNSVNSGNLEGSNVYGISMYASKANNVVSMGIINNNTNEGYSFWPGSSDVTCTHLYGMNTSCVNCGESVTLFSLESKRNVFVIDDENHTRVDELLNIESNEMNYGMYWSKGLSVIKALSIQIEIESKATIKREVEFGVALKDIEEIHPFF